jgi:hypothetical protein
MKKLVVLAVIGAAIAWAYQQFVAEPPEDVWQQATTEPDFR